MSFCPLTGFIQPFAIVLIIGYRFFYYYEIYKSYHNFENTGKKLRTKKMVCKINLRNFCGANKHRCELAVSLKNGAVNAKRRGKRRIKWGLVRFEKPKIYAADRKKDIGLCMKFGYYS